MTRTVLCLLAYAAVCATAGYAQTLQPASTVAHNTPQMIDLFVGGNIKNVLGQPSGTATASGSVGLRYRGDTFVVHGLINIAGTNDSIRTGHGATLLQPAVGKALNAGLVDVRAPRFSFFHNGCRVSPSRIPCHLGVHAYVSASSFNWVMKDTAQAQRYMTVPIWGAGVDLSYSFVLGELRGEGANDNKKIAMIFDAGWAVRNLRGDFSSAEANVAARRHDLLQSNKTNFSGWEAGLTLQVDLLTTGITYYYFPGTINGFSRGQLVAGASVQANLASGRYSREQAHRNQ